MTLDDIMSCRPGTILKKGSRRREILGWTAIGGLRYIVYKTPSKRGQINAEEIDSFGRWAEGAEYDKEAAIR